jgi:hypothetical protein
MQPKYRWSWWAAISLCAVAWIVLHVAGHSIARENGLMENQQALCLAIAALVFAIAARRHSSRPDKLVCISLALFCFSFLLREVELKGRTPDWLESIFTGKLRRLWLAGLWLCLLILARRHARAILRVFVEWLRRPAGGLMIAAGIFYGLTWPLDKHLLNLPGPLNMFLEELGDSIATMLILLSSAWTCDGVNVHQFRERQTSIVGRPQRLEKPRVRPQIFNR